MSQVDVIIPCYNYGRYLENCVHSVLSQQGVKVRVLIIDDCSQDHTAAVGERLTRQDSRVEFRRHLVNQGHICTYNEGLKWAQGDCVLLISADDILTFGALERAARVLDSCPDVALVYGRDIVFDREHPQNKQILPTEYDWQIHSYREFLERSCALGHTGIQAPTVVVRTSVHKKAGEYRKELPHTADTEIWLRLAAHGTVAVLGADQAFRRIHQQNMSFTFSPLERLKEQKAAFDVHFREYRDAIPECDRLERLLHRTLAEAACWGASHAFDRREVWATQEYLAFAMSVYPQIRFWGPWARFRWKRFIGPRIWSLLRPLAKRFRERTPLVVWPQK